MSPPPLRGTFAIPLEWLQSRSVASAGAKHNPDKILRVIRSWAYPKQVIYLLASFAALVCLCHYIPLLYRLFTRKRTVPSGSTSTHGEIRNGTVKLWRLPSAIADTFKAVAFRWTWVLSSDLSFNLAEIFVSLAYPAILLTWTFVNTKNLLGVSTDARYYANRAGTIAGAQLPILVALGMRNNLVSVITGISYEKLSLLHRVSARSILVLIWIHAGGRLKLGLTGDEVLSMNRWVQCGVLSAACLSALLVLSVRPFRKCHYEFFLFVHFILAVTFLVGLYFHFNGRKIPFFGVWPAMIIWGLDRFFSYLRLVLFNTPNFFSSRSDATSSKASITVLSPNFITISFTRPRSALLRWFPGQSAYLCVPSLSISGPNRFGAVGRFLGPLNPLAWESHPFTILSLPSESLSAPELGRELKFLVRVHRGFTRRLMEGAIDSRSSIDVDTKGDPASEVANMEGRHEVWFNGPYSYPPILIGYDTVILVAGGSGISFTLPLFVDLVRRTRLDSHLFQKLVFVWAIRDASHIEWIAPNLLSTLSTFPKDMHSRVSVQFYVTSRASSSSSSESLSDDIPDEVPTPTNDYPEKLPSSKHVPLGVSPKKLFEAQSPSICVSLARNRPHIEDILNTEIGNTVEGGRVSVNVCGPQGLSQRTRKALRKPRFMDVLRGGPTITLHVEGFGM